MFRDFVESGELESLEVTVRPLSESKFALSPERDVEDFLEENLQVMEPGLKLYRDGELAGRQFGTDVSRIDLLGVDAGWNFVVIELKVGRGQSPKWNHLS